MCTNAKCFVTLKLRHKFYPGFFKIGRKIVFKRYPKEKTRQLKINPKNRHCFSLPGMCHRITCENFNTTFKFSPISKSDFK